VAFGLECAVDACDAVGVVEVDGHDAFVLGGLFEQLWGTGEVDDYFEETVGQAQEGAGFGITAADWYFVLLLNVLVIYLPDGLYLAGRHLLSQNEQPDH
jgi:hypothetical protein